MNTGRGCFLVSGPIVLASKNTPDWSLKRDNKSPHLHRGVEPRGNLPAAGKDPAAAGVFWKVRKAYLVIQDYYSLTQTFNLIC